MPMLTTREPSAVAPAAGDRPLDIPGVAEYASLSPATIRTMVRDGKMPSPDGKMGQSQWWWESTIDAWQQTRPTVGRPKS